jgi:hypothetical protein
VRPCSVRACACLGSSDPAACLCSSDPAACLCSSDPAACVPGRACAACLCSSDLAACVPVQMPVHAAATLQHACAACDLVLSSLDVSSFLAIHDPLPSHSLHSHSLLGRISIPLAIHSPFPSHSPTHKTCCPAHPYIPCCNAHVAEVPQELDGPDIKPLVLEAVEYLRRQKKERGFRF